MSYGGGDLKAAPIAFPKAPGSPSEPRTKARRASTPRPKKGKKPCKYGARGSDGLCPKKPRATPAQRVVAQTLGLKTPKATGRTSTGTKLERAVERAVVTRAVSGGARAARKVAGAAAAEVAAYGGLKAITKQLLLRPAFAGIPAAVLSNLALAAGAGAASFLITSKVLQSIRDAKERRQQAAYLAAQKFRAARLEAAQRLGRNLTLPELQILEAEFDLKNLMRKAGL